MKNLLESIFDDDLASKKPTLPCGLTIDDDIWNRCKKYAEERIKRYFGSLEIGDHDSLGDGWGDYALCYKSKDSLVMIGIDPDDYYNQTIYILCPETVYFHLNYSDKSDPVHLEDVRLANDFAIAFYAEIGSSKIIWGRSYNNLRNKKDLRDYIEHYMPATIDQKAKKVIEKLFRDKNYRESFLNI